jgi:hypothetical protein
MSQTEMPKTTENRGLLIQTFHGREKSKTNVLFVHYPAQPSDFVFSNALS